MATTLHGHGPTRAGICLLLIALAPLVAWGAFGDLDDTFGNAGTVTSPIHPSSASAIAIQPDGKIVVAGPESFSGQTGEISVARYTSSGDVDTTFGQGGTLTTRLVPAAPRNVLAYAFGVVVQPDGRIVVGADVNPGAGGCCSPAEVRLLRYESDGQLDTGFGNAGVVAIADPGAPLGALGLLRQPDGKLVIGATRFLTSGWQFELFRVNPDGSADTTFGASGSLSASVGLGGDGVYAVALQTDGKLIAGGATANNTAGFPRVFGLLRCNQDGSLDGMFGNGGAVRTPVESDGFVRALALQPDGKIVAAGDTVARSNGDNVFSVVRYNPDGTLDGSFATGGVARIAVGHVANVGGVAVQADGGILVAGDAHANGFTGDFVVARLETNGLLDSAFGAFGISGSVTEGGGGRAHAAALQPDQKLVVAGVQGGSLVLKRYSTATTPPCEADQPSTCGNGRVEPGEACDDGNRSDGDGCDRRCATVSADYGLLARFQPIIRYDRDELYRSVAVGALIATAGSRLERDDDAHVAIADVSALGPTYGDGTIATSDDALVAAPDAGCDSACTSARWFDCHGGHVYGRAVHGRRNSTILQYWYFHYRHTVDGDTRAGHQGDWKLIQMHLPGAGAPPDAVFYSQQGTGQQCPWPRIELLGDRPVFYQAAGSHGFYPAAGSTVRDEGIDDDHRGDASSGEQTLELVTDNAPSWVAWPGRWGGTDGSAFVSPLGPAFVDAGAPWDRPPDLDWEVCQ